MKEKISGNVNEMDNQFTDIDKYKCPYNTQKQKK